MDDIDCKLHLLLALQQKNRRRSSAAKTPSTAGPPDVERQRPTSELCLEEERDAAGRQGDPDRAAATGEFPAALNEASNAETHCDDSRDDCR